jgi:energy-coupling factor transporter ATP-binding protein EcfA2
MKRLYQGIYIAAGIAVGVKMILLPEPPSNLDSGSIMAAIVKDSGVTNAVAVSAQYFGVAQAFLKQKKYSVGRHKVVK